MTVDGRVTMCIDHWPGRHGQTVCSLADWLARMALTQESEVWTSPLHLTPQNMPDSLTAKQKIPICLRTTWSDLVESSRLNS